MDISQDNVDYANSMTSDKTEVICSDSVKYLWSLPKEEKIDFLYLDSYDINKNNPHPSQLHHVKEIIMLPLINSERVLLCVSMTMIILYWW